VSGGQAAELLERGWVVAAGGVVLRPGRHAPQEIALVHRPAYDDWTLPKGKLDADESLEVACLREVREETGLRCKLLDPAGSTEYVDGKGRPKVVFYWLLRPVGGRFRPSHEVDELRWLPLPDALSLLTYARDRELLRGVPALRQPAGRG
jgi:8-oxo-dGTP pyrophosphatase MutT (NUDIX family)